MLEITVPKKEWYDEQKNEFTNVKAQKIRLEHSLLSISKWESKWKRPFLDESYRMSYEEILDYIRCMTLTQNVDSYVYRAMTRENLRDIMNYMKDPMTATTFTMDKLKPNGGKPKRGPKSRIVTSEVLYARMVQYGVPLEAERWHLNRLLTLLRVLGEESKDKKPMSKREIMKQNAALNAARRKRLNTKG